MLRQQWSGTSAVQRNSSRCQNPSDCSAVCKSSSCCGAGPVHGHFLAQAAVLCTCLTGQVHRHVFVHWQRLSQCRPTRVPAHATMAQFVCSCSTFHSACSLQSVEPSTAVPQPRGNQHGHKCSVCKCKACRGACSSNHGFAHAGVQQRLLTPLCEELLLSRLWARPQGSVPG